MLTEVYTWGGGGLETHSPPLVLSQLIITQYLVLVVNPTIRCLDVGDNETLTAQLSKLK